MWGFLGLLLLAWDSHKAKIKAEKNRQRISEKYTKSTNPADYEYDLWEARIKKYSEKYPKHISMDRLYLTTLISLRNNLTPLSTMGDHFWIYKREEISDDELNNFREIRDSWEQEFTGKAEAKYGSTGII